MVVQHNLTAMNSNRMLGLTTSAQAKSTEKLSSGYKINRAADDAAGLSISEKMRKQIRGLSQASLNAQDGISAVQTAEGALNEVQDMLQRMNELAVKAANGTMSENDRSYIQDEIKQLETEIDRVAETTKFNETYLLKGDKNATEKDMELSYKKATVTFAEGTTALYTAEGKELDAEAAAEYLAENEDAVLYKTAAGAGKVAKADEHYEYEAGKDPKGKAKEILYVGDGTAATTYAADDEVGSILNTDADGFNAASTGKVYKSAGDAAQKLTLDSNKKLTAEVKLYDLTANKVVTLDATTEAATVEGYLANTANADSDNDIDDTKYVVLTAAAIGDVDNPEGGEAASADLADGIDKLYLADGTEVTDPADLLTAIEDEDVTLYEVAPGEEAGDTEYKADIPDEVPAFYDENGNWISENALTDYFKVGEDGTTITQKEGKTVYDKEGKALELTEDDIAESFATPEELVGALELKLHVGADATDNNQITVSLHAMSAKGLGVDGLKVDGADDTNARNAIETIKAAIQQVSQQRSALGAVQNRLEHTIANLDNVVENTTAAESQIRDTDMATEMVKYSNNNILAQAGQAMLAQANQSNQGVLSLLG